MKKKVVISVILSCFLFLITPCINAIQIHEIREEIENRIQDNIKSNYLNAKSTVLVNKLAIYIFLIIYIIGYIVFIPVLIVMLGHMDQDGHMDLIEFIEILLACFLWPYILLDIIRAYIEGHHIP